MDALQETLVHVALTTAANDAEQPRVFPVLTPGAPLEAPIRCLQASAALARLDRLIQIYRELPEVAQQAVDRVATDSVNQAVVHHQRVARHFDAITDLTYRPALRTISTMPVPPGLLCVAALVIAADAAFDLLEQDAGNPRSVRWLLVYRGLLKRTLNRTLDAALQQRATMRTRP